MFLLFISFIFAYFNLQDHPVMVESESEDENSEIESDKENTEIESETIQESSDREEVDWINLNSHPVDDVSDSSLVSVAT
jgi:hypothetical protein